MALGDLIILEQALAMSRGGRLYNVGAGTAILAGEPVMHSAVGGTAVMPMITNSPTVSAGSGVEGLFVGVATTTSTNTAADQGIVYVLPVNPYTTYLINPDTAASWDTQTEYNALVGKRVLIKNSTTVTSTAQNVGSYTLLASDSAANGAVVMAMNINEHPAKVAIAFRMGTSDLI